MKTGVGLDLIFVLHKSSVVNNLPKSINIYNAAAGILQDSDDLFEKHGVVPVVEVVGVVGGGWGVGWGGGWLSVSHPSVFVFWAKITCDCSGWALFSRLSATI